MALEQERLARYVLGANADAEVVDVEVKAGELAVVGSPAVTLADTAHPYVDVFVPEGGMDGVKLGAPATVRAVVPRPVSLVLLSDVLRRLVEEGVSVRDLRAVLEALSTVAACSMTSPVSASRA